MVACYCKVTLSVLKDANKYLWNVSVSFLNSPAGLYTPLFKNVLYWVKYWTYFYFLSVAVVRKESVWHFNMMTEVPKNMLYIKYIKSICKRKRKENARAILFHLVQIWIYQNKGQVSTVRLIDESYRWIDGLLLAHLCVCCFWRQWEDLMWLGIIERHQTPLLKVGQTFHHVSSRR